MMMMTMTTTMATIKATKMLLLMLPIY